MKVPNSIAQVLLERGFTAEEIHQFDNFFNCFNESAVRHIANIVIPMFWEFFESIKVPSVQHYDHNHFIHFTKYFLDGTTLKSTLKEADSTEFRAIYITVNYYLEYTKEIIKEYQYYLKDIGVLKH